ncbi:ABC transporter ATP-binding protein [Oscillospiraceae bacterium CM]|nr:ABC transporter ATP-binding protein [Oscillospiraceae bacterium CM]
MDILSLRHVSKSFGSLDVIRDLNLTVREHAVYGLIGKNGAGKTTTMKMVLGFLKATAGEITVCGEKVVYGQSKTNRHIGYLPDVPEFYGFMRPMEYLTLCGEISGMTPSDIKRRAGELLECVGLGTVNRKIGGFSRGMKQRLGIAQALLGAPKLLICDEPTSALDPVGRKELLDILQGVRSETAIIFSTHILADVERVCDDIGILDGGRLVLSGRLSEVKNTYRSDCVFIEPAKKESAGQLAEKLALLPDVKSAAAAENGVIAQLQSGGDARAILSALVSANLAIVKFEVREPSLEDVFLEVIQ